MPLSFGQSKRQCSTPGVSVTSGLILSGLSHDKPDVRFSAAIAIGSKPGKELKEYTWTPLKQSAIGVSELRLPEPPPTFQTID